MRPTVFREGPFRFFFFSREETRRHVHVESPEGVAKFWIEPSVELAYAHGMRERDVSRARVVVNERKREIEDAWDRHFGS